MNQFGWAMGYPVILLCMSQQEAYPFPTHWLYLNTRGSIQDRKVKKFVVIPFSMTLDLSPSGIGWTVPH